MSRTVFLGTSEFAATVLGQLAASTHRPSLVIAPPARPRGRGRKPAPAPVATRARELGIDLFEAADVNDVAAREAITAAEPEIGCVCAFGQMIREPLLSRLEMLNLHPSLLPRWRGAAPIERAIMAGDTETGVCVIRLEAGLDSGPLALRERTPISPDEDYGTLSSRLEEIGGGLLLRALDLAAAGELELNPQPAEGITYAEKIEPSERQLDPSRPAAHLARVVRALSPHIGAHLTIDGGGRLGVSLARAEGNDLPEGEIRADGGGLRLGCSEGVLRIERVKPPGSRSMDAAAYLRGHAAPRRALVP